MLRDIEGDAIHIGDLVATHFSPAKGTGISARVEDFDGNQVVYRRWTAEGKCVVEKVSSRACLKKLELTEEVVSVG